MAKKISQLTQATQVKSDDVTVIVQDGETKKLPLNMMVTKQDIENKKVTGLAKLDEIEATYENDTYTPTITVKNKSSVKVGEGDGVDYSANVMDGPAKSAILKGQTLVNLFENPIGYEYVAINKAATSQINLGKADMLKPNTTYTFVYSLKDVKGTISPVLNLMSSISQPDVRLNIMNGTIKQTFTTPTNYNGSNQTLRLYYQMNVDDNENSSSIAQTILLEGDYSNIDIPYFEGMQSVKMPVLTTVGKNLFDGKLEVGNIQASDGEVYGLPHMRVTDFIKINANKTITISKLNNNDIDFRLEKVSYYDINKNFISIDGELFMFPKTLTPPTGTAYIRAVFCKGNWDETATEEDFKTLQVQIEKNVSATSYEPYKSNILTVNEEIELRGIGDVKDELNLITGELTQRIGEVVLDGSDDENWNILNYTLENTVLFKLTVFDMLKQSPKINSILSDKFRVDISSPYENDSDFIFPNEGLGNNFVIRISKNKLESCDVSGFRKWLIQNNVKVQYRLATESIKTVDLMPSGTHPSTTPYCWKNGHIQLSSSGLLPNLEYSVVTSRAGQINQNATMIVKNDKRIFDLEILLAGGLVNTTYQALTLQNQVETGLSKVSLNSETEPDYLLYHMIMKLIEEKAYKLDDLTEKVSVFYLYEKLSDEQFETIYSALYPFAEDEIIEEPVVEELPEVVEDEVIM